MPRTTTRNFFDVFRHAGITLLGRPPKLSDDLQMVSIVDDWSWANADSIPKSLYAGVSSGVAAASGRNGALELQTRNQNGIIIDAIRDITASASPAGVREVFIYILEERQVGFIEDTELVIRMTSKPGVQTRAATGTILQADLFANQGLFTIQGGLENGVDEFHITNGLFLYIALGNKTNAFFSPACLFHELNDDAAPT